MPEYRFSYAHNIVYSDLVGRWFVIVKVYKWSLSYAEGKHFDFMQSFYTAL